MGQSLRVENASPVATIWLDRPRCHNAFDAAMIGELDAALLELEADSAVRVLVLAGAGRSFCSGADLNWMARTADAGLDENLEDARRFAAMLQRLALLRKPTIARVQGVAAGGGVGLAAACDICVATPDATFALSEVRLGLVPAVIAPYIVRALGPRQALRFMLSAERIDAAHAHRLGLVHEVRAAAQIDGLVADLCAALSAGAPQAQAQVKALVAQIAGQGPTDAIIEHTARALARRRVSEEARLGVGAFLAGNTPDWAQLLASETDGDNPG